LASAPGINKWGQAQMGLSPNFKWQF